MFRHSLQSYLFFSKDLFVEFVLKNSNEGYDFRYI